MTEPAPADSRGYAHPELLAPAGGQAALRAAVNNGADAVYLGVDVLNARRGAENFTLESLPAAVDFAHMRGVRVYLTANVAVLEGEMQGALELVDAAWVAGVDAVIVQDLGLLSLLRSELPDVRVHASTQINSHNSGTIEALAGLGVSRVTLARETSLGEIASLSSAARIETESFVHGALCVCYSGQCLMSSLIGGRSANRGLCAQPCRLAYELIDEHGAAKSTPGAHLLSPKDLCGIEEIPALVASGVAALKIEGRMKSPEYVALVTGTYRAALDRALEDPDAFQVTEAEESVLAEAFSRGFSSAYLTDERGNDMMSYARPNNRGIPVGRVVRAAAGSAMVSLDRALDADDTVEYWTGRGRFAQRVGAIELDGRRVNVAPVGARIRVRTERPVGVGDRVFRVANAQLEEAARRTFAEGDGPSLLMVDVAVRVVTGEPLRVELAAGDVRAAAEGEMVESARTKAVTAEEIAEHVGRFGGTGLAAGSWDIALSPGAGVGFSQLHRVRRDAVEALRAALLAPWSGRAASAPRAVVPTVRRRRAEVPEIVVRTDELRVARACLAAGAQRAIVPSWALIGESDVPAGVVPEVARVLHDREFDDALAAVQEFPRAVVGNLGAIGAAVGIDRVLESHWSMNVLNPWSVHALKGIGARFVWLSPELSGKQIASISAVSPLPVGIAVYGRQETMVMEHCVLMSLGECGQVCGTCPRRASWYALRDAKGYAFPVSTDPTGRSHVYNSVPLDLTRALPEIVGAGVDAIRLDFTVEHLQEAQKITRLVREAVSAVVAGKPGEDSRLARSVTTGHFFRGVQ